MTRRIKLSEKIERITFHFEGGLSDDHSLNFYESARFQYAAARFITKLAQFQQSGEFKERITEKTNTGILLEAHGKGSFDIMLLAPLVPAVAEVFITVPISSLMSYVMERLFAKTEDSDVAKALNAQVSVVKEFGKIKANDNELMSQALALIERQGIDLSNAKDAHIATLQQRIAEQQRDAQLIGVEKKLAKISPKQEQKLLKMGGPLVSEMATALRSSADTLEIYTERSSKKRKLAYIDNQMIDDLTLTTVDEDVTAIRVDIIQYNKETGWGKLRLQETKDLKAFNVPSDLKSKLKNILFSEMRKTQTFVQSYIVRDNADDPVRLIVVGVIPE